jgi:hypothetical protein
MPAKSIKKYVSNIPNTVRAGRVLVHNSARHDPTTRPGPTGFRAWLDAPQDKYVICSCGWAPQIKKHYRVDRSKG